MNRCPQCASSLPRDAAFCIYCATQLRPASPPAPTAPATGATIRLDPLASHAPARPARPRPPRHMRRRQHRHQHRPGQNILGPVFVVGVLFLLLTRTFFFPGILVLLGLIGFMRASFHGRPYRAWQYLMFFGGMALLVWSGMPFWPSILLVMILSHVLSKPYYGWRP